MIISTKFKNAVTAILMDIEQTNDTNDISIKWDKLEYTPHGCQVIYEIWDNAKWNKEKTEIYTVTFFAYMDL